MLIKTRENYPSSMLPMGSLLSKRENRDVVEFLAGMKWVFDAGGVPLRFSMFDVRKNKV